MRVDSTTGIFHCFSCGFKGNIFDHFDEQANWLQITRDTLKNTIQAKLVEKVGVQIPKTAVPWDKDYRGISKTTYQKFNAFTYDGDGLANRIIIPIYKNTGKVAALVGRDRGPINMGPPKYLVHPPKAKMPLFPLVKPLNGRVILVEGLFDMLNLHDKGLDNSICCFGVNTVTKEKLNILKLQGVVGVDLCFDNDDAGKGGAKKLENLLESSELLYRYIDYDSDDPGDLTAQQVIKIKERYYSG